MTYAYLASNPQIAATSTVNVGRTCNVTGSVDLDVQVLASFVILDAEGDHIYLQEKVLKHIFDISTHTPSPTLYLAMSKIKPLAIHDGSTIDEPDDANYSRMAITSSQWSIDSQGRAFNNVGIDFPVAATDWGEYPFVVLLDSAVTGNIYKYARLDTPATTTSGHQYTIAADTHWLFKYADQIQASAAIRRVLQHFILTVLPTGDMGSLSLALSTDVPVNGDNALNIVEPNPDYGRFFIGVGTSDWSYASGVISNINAISFPYTNVTNTNLQYWVLTTSLFGGQMTFYGKLNSAKSTGPATHATISAGEIRLSLSQAY